MKSEDKERSGGLETWVKIATKIMAKVKQREANGIEIRCDQGDQGATRLR